MKNIGLVVPTTHWDRAWYWHNERYRIKLIELFIRLEKLWDESAEYKFTLDGQAIALEDYLEVFPEKRELYCKMGREGRFKCGPLYVLSDMWLTSGESFIRNYLVGSEMAKKFEACQEVIYQPDSFGFPPEMPMLISGLGSDVYLTMRGISGDKVGDSRFFTWRSADGSEVKVLRLRDGYANAAALGLHNGSGEVMDKKSSGIHPVCDMGRALNKLTGVFERLCDGQGEPRLLLAGGDHQLPQMELPKILENFNNNERLLRFSDLDECAVLTLKQDFEDKPVVEGELNAWSAHKLGGTVSTRIYLKINNSRAEQLLCKVAEPLDASLSLLGIDCPEGAAVKTAWKYLLKVHPHDDITGCGVDPVHREDETLIVHAAESAHALRRRCMQLLLNQFGGQVVGDERSGFAVFSTLGRSQVHRIRIIVDFEGRYNYGDSSAPEAGKYILVDENGEEVQFREVARGDSIEHPHKFIELDISCNFRPFALTRFFFQESNVLSLQNHEVFENEFLKVTFNGNGSANIFHKASGLMHRDIGLFSDQVDVGDEYTFAPDGEETVFDDILWKRSSVSGNMQTVKFEGELPVGEETIPMVIEYSLAPDEKHLTCRVAFENRAENHRLRFNMAVPKGIEMSRAGIHFSEATRAVGEACIHKDDLVELPIWPTDHFVAGEVDDVGLALFTPCPMNYEIIPGENSRLAVTICRSIGILSVREKKLTTVPGAGPTTPTPEAQCLGRKLDFTFAIRPYKMQEKNKIFAESMNWRTPLPYDILWGANEDWNGKPTQSLFALQASSPIVISAFKQEHKRNGGIIVRLFNASQTPQSTAMIGFEDKQLVEIRLNEKQLTEQMVAGYEKIHFKPFELRTFKID